MKFSTEKSENCKLKLLFVSSLSKLVTAKKHTHKKKPTNETDVSVYMGMGGIFHSKLN